MNKELLESVGAFCKFIQNTTQDCPNAIKVYRRDDVSVSLKSPDKEVCDKHMIIFGQLWS